MPLQAELPRRTCTAAMCQSSLSMPKEAVYVATARATLSPALSRAFPPVTWPPARCAGGSFLICGALSWIRANPAGQTHGRAGSVFPGAQGEPGLYDNAVERARNAARSSKRDVMGSGLASLAPGRRRDVIGSTSPGSALAASLLQEPLSTNSGSMTLKVAPSFWVESMARRPRWRATTCLTRARPRPVPPLARLWPASTR